MIPGFRIATGHLSDRERMLIFGRTNNIGEMDGVWVDLPKPCRICNDESYLTRCLNPDCGNTIFWAPKRDRVLKLSYQRYQSMKAHGAITEIEIEEGEVDEWVRNNVQV